jgi:hypothetical protein
MGTIAEALESAPIVAYASGAVVFGLDLDDGLTTRDAIALGAPGLPLFVLAREGDPAPQTPAGVTYGSLSLITAPPDADAPMWTATLDGAAPATDFAIYARTTVSELVMFEGRPAPGSAGGGTFSSVFPGLTDLARRAVADDGSLLFANLLTSGAVSGIFWIIPDCGLFTVARSGGDAPGGDLFGSFSPASAQTASAGCAIFRAPLQSAGSGIFRQGP